MKVHIRLFGILGNKFPDHDPLKGFALEVPEGSTVEDLIKKLDIPPQSKIGIVSINGQLVKIQKQLNDGDFIRVFQPISGG
jgi:sulfur carrier protein ThiS